MAYKVYMHVSPDNKRYIGATRQLLGERFGKFGKGYADNIPLFNDILKYGWINFQHIVVAEDLTREEAFRLEKQLIKEYNTLDRRYGYNSCIGATPKTQSDRENLKKKILCVETGEIYDGLRQTERLTGINQAAISQVCNRKDPHRKTAGGYHWEYLTDNKQTRKKG